MLVGPNIDQQAFAARTLKTLLRSSPQLKPAIELALRDYDLKVQVVNGEPRIFDARGGEPGMATRSASGNPNNQWATANRTMGDNAISAATKTSNANAGGLSGASPQSGANQGGTWEQNWINSGGASDILGADQGPGFSGSFESGGASDPSDITTQNPRYKGSFFSGVQPDALDELAANPDQAWSLFRTRGGPGGGDLRNSTASIYGQNNFGSAMNLAGILGGRGMGPQDTLGFTSEMMQQGMNGGGRYVDPAKILNAAFQNIGKEPDAFTQQNQIKQTLDSLEPYMDPTQYQALQSRIGRVMDDYLAYGLENGTSDLSGVLLQAMQRAIGM